MSNIKALEELRGWVDGRDGMGIAPLMVRNAHKIADAIEAEVAERFMEVPVDSDGVPIRIGDEMEWTNSHNGEKERFVCAGYTTEYSTWTYNNITLMATNDECAEFYCDQCRHVQPDTVESLLDEFMVALHELGEGADYGPTKERMAERIRKAVE